MQGPSAVLDRGAAPEEATKDADTGPVKKRAVGLLSASKDSYLQIALNRFVLPGLLHPVGKAVVLLVLAAALAVGFVGSTRLDEGLTFSQLAPDGHYIKAYDALFVGFESQAGAHPALSTCLCLAPGCSTLPPCR